MACGQAKSNTNNNLRQPRISEDQAKRPQGIKKQQALRKSSRLQAIGSLRKRFTSESNLIQKVQIPPSPPASSILKTSKAQQSPQILPKPSVSFRKREREQEEQEAGQLSPRIRYQPPSKRLRTSPPSCTAELGLKEKKKEEEAEERASGIDEKNADPLEYWTLTKRWPKEYFEQDSQVRDNLEQDSWLEEQMENSTQVVKYVETNGWRLPCPIRKVPTSLRRKQSDSSLNSSSDQKNREAKSAPYRNTRYITLLEGKGSYIKESRLGVTEASLARCKTLLDSEQTVPKDSLFRDDLFSTTCDKVQDRNEARVIRSITPYIVPSAEDLETLGATHLEHLIESINEGWTASIPVEGPRPQPDYSVGFRRSAFTDKQFKKLHPLIGSVYDTSLFAATYRIYFPFFTCEVKCGAAALDVADRQNAHSMTVAVKGIVELYKAVQREKELDREILTFSISHDHTSVRIYGHYPLIEGDKTTFYRHPIHSFSFTALNGKEKWTAYKFVKNVYDYYSLKIHNIICSGIDGLPADINFDVSQSASFSQSGPQSSQQSNAESILGEDDSQSSLMAPQEVTPTTSLAQTTERASKKPRNRRAMGEQR